VQSASLCTELVSTHAGSLSEVKLWQVDRTPHAETQYWFTKLKDLVCHEDAIVTQSLSPDGSTIATLSKDETIGLWKVFDPITQTKK